MDEEKAREILRDWIVEADNGLDGIMPDICWVPWKSTVSLEGDDFTADQLGAIAWWMENKGV